MALQITTASDLSIGGAEVSNIYGTMVTYPTATPDGGLLVNCDLSWWLSLTEYNDGKALVYPMSEPPAVDGVTPPSKPIVNAFGVVITPEQAMAANLPLTIYQEVANNLMSLNPTMNIVVVA